MSPKALDMNRRDILRLGGIAGGAFLLGPMIASCSADSSPGGNGDSPDAGFDGEIAVAHLLGIMSGAPFLVAEELGYFEEAGMNPELVSFPGGADTIRGVASGIKFGMPATLPALTAFQKGQKNLRLISGALNTATVNFIVPSDSDIEDISDLRGKTIAVSAPGSITTYFANRIAEEQGLKPGVDVTILNVGGPPDAWTATKQGIADAAWSSPPLSTLLTTDGSARVLFETSDHVKNWADNTYWTTQDVIDESPETLRQILRVLKRAVVTIQDDPDTAVPVYAKRVELDEAVARKALSDVAPYLDFKIDMAGIEENVRAGADLGQIDASSLNLDDVIVKDFVEDL